MRKTLLLTAALGLAMAGPAFVSGTAFAQSAGNMAYQTHDGARPGNVIGTGDSLPRSNRASNIDEADTHSAIAPNLPNPEIGPDATPHDLLAAAHVALAQRQTGKAQAALEMAETRALDRSTAPSQANLPDQTPLVQKIDEALHALGTHDVAGAQDIIVEAMNMPSANGGMGMSGSMGGGTMAPPPPMPSGPTTH